MNRSTKLAAGFGLSAALLAGCASVSGGEQGGHESSGARTSHHAVMPAAQEHFLRTEYGKAIKFWAAHGVGGLASPPLITLGGARPISVTVHR